MHSGRQIQCPAIGPMKSTQIFSSPFLGGLPPWLAHPVGALLVMLLVLSSSALGAEEDGDFFYERAGVGARVTGYRGSSGAVVIPERLGGSPVTSIGNYAFNGRTGLTGLYFQGQSPRIGFGGLDGGGPIFDAVGPTTVYHLPGSSGWYSTFEGRPTVLWLPQMRNVAASSGGQDNQFGFDVSWAPGQTVVVEAATDLAAPV